MPDSRSEEHREDAARLRAGAAKAETETMRRMLLESAAELEVLADKIEKLSPSRTTQSQP
jgi:hypothetical protein